MVRIAYVLLIALVCIQQGYSLRCYDCSTLHNPNCDDPLDNRTIPVVDCNQLKPYDLTYSPQCRKIKYRDNGRWLILRDCNVNENIILRDAQVYLCNTHACNTAGSHSPITLLTTLTAPILFAFLRSVIF